ncbi:hypothetical protein F0562_027395 [Nyssa sinensis]|uniref:Uncharacterized protein n=1 Tax=Nyssa sinensis TaxID=561372 RepID=A0A5J5B438_9ASTE|nr:hypothetical protein F0562_027395 [Nyssa sinensis]
MVMTRLDGDFVMMNRDVAPLIGRFGGAGSGFAEAYVMRKLHKEKMKRMEMEIEIERADQREVIADDGKVSGGCFSMMFKKIHPTAVPSPPPDSTANQAGI